MKNKELINKISTIIDIGNKLYNNTHQQDIYSEGYVTNGDFAGFKSLCLSFIYSLYGKNHSYYKEFEKASNDCYISNIDESISILNVIRFEIENGWLKSLKKIISSEFFADFLEMSKYLLDEGYKDAAAVMIGSTLEEHLRLMCKENNIDISVNKMGKDVPKKADTLNGELYKANIYNSLNQKSITYWLDLRNKAAHGKYDDYTSENVRLMYEGVLSFISQD